LAAEKEGNYEAPVKKQLQKLAVQTQQADEAEQKETAESLLPRRRRRLLQRIKYSKRMKQQAISKLEEKKTKISRWKSKSRSQKHSGVHTNGRLKGPLVWKQK